MQQHDACSQMTNGKTINVATFEDGRHTNYCAALPELTQMRDAWEQNQNFPVIITLILHVVTGNRNASVLMSGIRKLRRQTGMKAC